MDTNTQFRLGYRPGLDGVRALAVLMVMWFHTFAELLPQEHGALTGGFTGVDIFFVLSGFLITSLLVERSRENRLSYKDFYRRRALRLLPALFAFLVADAVISAALHHDLAAELRSVVAAATYTTNWAWTTHVRLAPNLIHLWSLSIEEQFYVVWPLVLVFLLRRRPRTMFVTLAAAVVAVGVWRSVLSVHYSQAYPSVYVRTDTRADALLVGALLALALHFGWQPGRSFRRIAGWVGLAVLMAVVLLGQNAAVGKTHAGFLSPDRILYNGGFTIVALASAALILGALGGADLLNRGLSRRPVVATGRISYSLYLWHPIVFELVALAVAGSVARVALAWPAAFAVAAFSRRFVEEPFLDAGRSASRSQVPRRQAVVARPWMLALVATVVLVIAGADLALIGQRNVTPPAAHAQPARTTQ